MRLKSFRLGWILAVALFALPGLARAGQLYGDFDRDGRRDSVSVDPNHASVVTVWLSSTNTLRVLQSNQPIARVGVFDLDGDGHPELVAADTTAGLHVWRSSGDGKLQRYAPRRHAPRAREATPTNFDDDENAADGPMAGGPKTPAPFDVSTPTTPSASLGRLETFPTTSPLGTDTASSPKSSRAPPAPTFLR